MKTSWIVLIVIVAAAAVWIVWDAAQPDATVDVIHARIDTIRASVTEQATTELPHDFLVAMPISGWLEPVTLREGDAVTKDQVVARLETNDLEDRVTQARARIARLETDIRETSDHRLENNALVDATDSIEATDEEQEGDVDADATEEDEDDDHPDLLLRESARIVVDMIELGSDEPTLARYFSTLGKEQGPEGLN